VWTQRKAAGWLAAIVTTAVLGVVAACGDGNDPVGSGSGAFNPAADNPAAEQGGGGTDNGSGSGGGGSSDDFQWPVFGPGDSPDPPGWGLYVAFAHRDCAGVESVKDDAGQDFGAALAALCSAVVDGRDDQWDVAAAAFARDEDPDYPSPCLRPVLVDTLRTALAWHDAHPGQQPKVGFPTVSGETSCGEQDRLSRNATPPPDPTTTDPTTDESSTDEPSTDEPSTDESEPSG
jgi:hypothetical protein